MIELVCPGPPTPRREPHIDFRNGKRVVFPDKDTEAGIYRWQRVWKRAGQPFVAGPIELDLLIERPRPPSHYRPNGTLSRSGAEHAMPPRPDCSNVLKLVEDALKRHAFGDDSLVATATTAKRYGPVEQMTLSIRPWAGALPVQATLIEEAAP